MKMNLFFSFRFHRKHCFILLHLHVLSCGVRRPFLSHDARAIFTNRNRHHTIQNHRWNCLFCILQPFREQLSIDFSHASSIDAISFLKRFSLLKKQSLLQPQLHNLADGCSAASWPSCGKSVQKVMAIASLSCRGGKDSTACLASPL